LVFKWSGSFTKQSIVPVGDEIHSGFLSIKKRAKQRGGKALDLLEVVTCPKPMDIGFFLAKVQGKI
jgi:hypothetical protein